jgi:hypothetical protein
MTIIAYGDEFIRLRDPHGGMTVDRTKDAHV